MDAIKIKGREYTYSQTIGRGASGGPGFRLPMDIARDGEVVYVLNRGSEGAATGRVTVFNTSEEFIGQFSSYGYEDGQFVWGSSIVVDKNGFVYLADEWLHRISIFNGRADFANADNPANDVGQENFIKHWGVQGINPGELNGPAGMAFDKEDNLYITEEFNHRVSKFTKDGEFLFCWGKQGTGDGEFNHPWGITIDSNDDVYVVDWKNDRVQKFTSSGEYIATFGSSGDKAGELHMPSDVAVDKEGDVYITDWWNNKVEVYDSSGIHLTTFYGDAVKLSKWAYEALAVNPDIKALHDKANKELERYFLQPTAVEVDSDGRIWVVDCMRWRIQIYQKTLLN